nr:hypothetical protein [Tanacetum cinerariifolium]
VATLASFLIVSPVGVILSTLAVTISLVVSAIVDLCDDVRKQFLKLLSDHCGDVEIPTSVANAAVVTIVFDVTVVNSASTASPTSTYIRPSAPWCCTTSANATSRHSWRHYLYEER